MLAEELGLRNFLNINVVYTRKLAQSITCLSLPLGRDASAQRAPSAHKIFITAVELKGSTTTEKLAPPAIDPGELSKGYGFKGPGEADKTAPQRWEVASYAFAPGFITVPQGDTITLTAFVVNGDPHDVAVLAPDGQVVVPTAIWQRGQEYQVSFVAEKAGTYHLKCFAHAPSITATFWCCRSSVQSHRCGHARLSSLRLASVM